MTDDCCPHCGEPLPLVRDAFCSTCGERLDEAPEIPRTPAEQEAFRARLNQETTKGFFALLRRLPWYFLGG